MSPHLRLLSLLLKLFVKPLLVHVKDPAANRELLERGARQVFRAPPFMLLRESWLEPDLRAVWISVRPGSHPVPPDKAVFYIHGGGFIAGSPETHAAMLARIARLTGVEVCALDYRIAPEQPFPAAWNDVRRGWDALVARGYDPGNIVIAGDSAGGNLALSLLAQLCAEGIKPAGMVGIAPHTDFTFQSPSILENIDRDTILPANRRDDVARWYLGEADPTDPRASPVYADFPIAPPPVLLQYAETEILRDDARRMAEVLRGSGGEVIEHAFQDAPHVFQIFDGWVPEAREALTEIARFIRQCLDMPDEPSTPPAAS